MFVFVVLVFVVVVFVVVVFVAVVFVVVVFVVIVFVVVVLVVVVLVVAVIGWTYKSTNFFHSSGGVKKYQSKLQRKGSTVKCHHCHDNTEMLQFDSFLILAE